MDSDNIKETTPREIDLEFACFSHYIKIFSEREITWDDTKQQITPVHCIKHEMISFRTRDGLRHHKTGIHRNVLHWINCFILLIRNLKIQIKNPNQPSDLANLTVLSLACLHSCFPSPKENNMDRACSQNSSFVWGAPLYCLMWKWIKFGKDYFNAVAAFSQD